MRSLVVRVGFVQARSIVGITQYKFWKGIADCWGQSHKDRKALAKMNQDLRLQTGQSWTGVGGEVKYQAALDAGEDW